MEMKTFFRIVGALGLIVLVMPVVVFGIFMLAIAVDEHHHDRMPHPEDYNAAAAPVAPKPRPVAEAIEKRQPPKVAAAIDPPFASGDTRLETAVKNVLVVGVAERQCGFTSEQFALIKYALRPAVLEFSQYELNEGLIAVVKKNRFSLRLSADLPDAVNTVCQALRVKLANGGFDVAPKWPTAATCHGHYSLDDKVLNFNGWSGDEVAKIEQLAKRLNEISGRSDWTALGVAGIIDQHVCKGGKREDMVRDMIGFASAPIFHQR
jgi:hypothetical protein